ncbi:MAG: amidohydrolase family protein [Clostridium sp.]|nr:amidohydrolase family protein [Clostridium sp.]
MQVLEHAYVDIKGGKIADYGEQKTMREYFGPVEVHDLGDAAILPGLIDAHTHMLLDFRQKNAASALTISYEEQMAIAEKNLLDDLRCGITSARYLGDKNYIDITMRDRIRTGKAAGPKAVVCGLGMKTPEGGSMVGESCDTPESFAKTSLANVEKGADFLKIFMTGTLLPEREEDPVPYDMSPEEVRTVTNVGQKHGLLTAVHCIGGEGLDICAENGVAVIEHVYGATDKNIEMMIKHGCRVCLTAGVFLDEERERNLPLLRREKGKKLRERIVRSMEKVIYSGIPLAVGTDAMHCGLAREVRYVSELGAGNRRALMAATIDAAKLCGTAEKTGSIEKDKDADLIVTAENPMENIRALEHIRMVIQNGRRIGNET